MIRSSVARFLFGSACLVLALAGMTAGATEEDEAWLERSRAILDRAQQEGAPDWLRGQPSDDAIAVAEGIAEASVPQGVRDRRQQQLAGKSHRTLIFGSLSLPRPTLIALLEEATAPDVAFVLRGVPQGRNIQDVARQLATLAKAELGDRVPNILVDPTRFKRHAVTVVPTMVTFVRPPHEVRIEGDVTLDLFRRLANTAAKNENVSLPRRGTVHEIAEPDLIIEMQRRLASIDWRAEKAKAVERFWKKKSDFVQLPDATEAREYAIDPSVRVTEDLHDAKGTVLVRAGDTINPLSWTTLSKTVIAFRGTDPRHVRKVLEEANRVRASGRGVILLTSTVDVDRAWEFLTELERELKGTVYVLPRVLAERLQIQRLPASVSARGGQLLVREIALGDAS